MDKNIKIKSNNRSLLKTRDIGIKVSKEKLSGKYDLQWTDKERKKLESRILNLRGDQIGALLWLVGLKFPKNSIEDVVKDIVNDKQESGHLCILTDEADSKENLLWWINYFEKANKK